MTSTGRFDHLRHAALDMLDAGNHMTAVSKLLAVPLPVIEQWRQEPVPPRPPAAAIAQHSDGQGRGLRFTKTLIVRRGFPHMLLRHVAIGYALAVAFIVALGWSVHRGLQIEGIWVDVTGLLICAAWWVQRDLPLLTLDADAIVVHEFLGRKKMPYADLADWWLVMHVRRTGEDNDEEEEGRLLTLFSRSKPARRIELFVHDHVEVDPAVIERLNLVKQANAGPGAVEQAGPVTTGPARLTSTAWPRSRR